MLRLLKLARARAALRAFRGSVEAMPTSHANAEWTDILTRAERIYAALALKDRSTAIAEFYTLGWRAEEKISLAPKTYTRLSNAFSRALAG